MRRWAAVAGATGVLMVLGGCYPQDPLPTTTTLSEEEANACEIERRTIRTALEAFKASHPEHVYPGSLEELVGPFLDGPPRVPWTYVSDGSIYSLTGPCM